MTKRIKKMSTSSFSEKISHIGYDNCIITRLEDSDDASSCSERSEPFQPVAEDPQDVKNESDSYINLTSAQIEDCELNAEDAFVFMLGMLNRIEKYFKNLVEDNHREWLKEQVVILKTVLVKHCDLFQICEVKDINGTTYFRNSTSEKHENENKVTDQVKDETELNLHTEVEIDTDYVKSEDSELDEKPVEVPDFDELNHTNSKPAESSKLNSCNINTKSESNRKPSEKLQNGKTRTNCRHSQRLQNIPEDKKGICSDKLTYISLKLESYSSHKLETPNSNKRVRQKRNQKNGQADNKQDMQSKIIKKKTTGRRTKSLGVKLEKNVQCEVSSCSSSKTLTNEKNDKNTRKKKRAASVDGRISKKAKKMPDTPKLNQQPGTSGITSSGKRKLYSHDSWLHSLSSTNLECT